MNKDQSLTMMGLLNQLEGVQLRGKNSGTFKFRMHMTKSMSDSALEELDLSVRSYNSLKRAGYHTVGDVVDAISSSADLLKIRNCGKTSTREIMEKLFLFQYCSLPVSRQHDYLMEVVDINKSSGSLLR